MRVLAALCAISLSCAVVPVDATPDDPENTNAQAVVVTDIVNGQSIDGLFGKPVSRRIFSITVPAGAERLTATLGNGDSSQNDAELFVKFNKAPTVNSFDCASRQPGLNELCRIEKPQPGLWFVVVRGVTDYVDASLNVRYEVMGADTVPPQVSVMKPASPAQGVMTLSASATDDVKIDRVEFLVDGELVGSASGMSFEISIDSEVLGNGTHTLQATAFDTAQNSGRSTVQFEVFNALTGAAAQSVHLTLGAPDDSSSSTNETKFLVLKTQFALSHNSTRKGANWVAWQLSPRWLGSASRSQGFTADPDIPSTLAQATSADYTNSGFDRGHLCPSADRTASATDNESTFRVTNILPQSRNSNGGPWLDLEDEGRREVAAGKDVFIYAGGLFEGPEQRIGSGVQVPSHFWKVFVVVPRGTSSAKGVRATSRVLAVVIPNRDADVAATADFSQYLVSVRSLETRTGLNFLSDVPMSIQEIVETRVGK
jgi:endonuclease G, mitochondrial